MNGFGNFAIPCHPYYATLGTILTSFFAFIMKSLLPILVYKMQVVSLHDVLKRSTGAYCSAHNLLIPILSKSLHTLPPAPSYSHQAASTSVCWGLGWWLFCFLFCAVWCTVTRPCLQNEILLSSWLTSLAESMSSLSEFVPKADKDF